VSRRGVCVVVKEGEAFTLAALRKKRKFFDGRGGKVKGQSINFFIPEKAGGGHNG